MQPSGRAAIRSRRPSRTPRATPHHHDARDHQLAEGRLEVGSLVTHYGDQLAYYANTVTDLLYYSPDYTRGRTMDTGDTFSDCDPCLEVFGVSTFIGFRTDVLDCRVHLQIDGYGTPTATTRARPTS